MAAYLSRSAVVESIYPSYPLELLDLEPADLAHLYSIQLFWDRKILEFALG